MGGDHAVSPGVELAGKPVTIRFGSRSITTVAGQSVLAALIGAGEMTCRTTASGQPRGAFCGMGVCQECIVGVAGEGNQRACMTKVRDGLVVEPLVSQPDSAAATAPPRTAELAPDVLVVGGGPAGLAAAAVAAEAGLDVVLVDERAKLGGQYYKQPAEGFRVDEAKVDRQFRNGRLLIRRVEAAGVRCLLGTTVWASFGAAELIASAVDATYVIRPKRTVLATGAYERGVPLPGWTLPGFMTTGAAQTLLRTYQITPGKRMLLGGNGPLNLQVAAELIRAGVEVVALAELAPKPGLRSLTSIAAMAAAAPDLVRDGLRYQATLRRAGVPTFYRHAIVRADGTSAVERVVIAEVDTDGKPVAGSEKRFDVDVVCAGFGFLPSNEIARAVGCRHHFDERTGQLVAERDRLGRSSVTHVWIAGDAGGLGGSRVAQAGGILAGADIVADLRGGLSAGLEAEKAAALRAKTTAATFQSALWSVYGARRMVDQLAEPETVVCRCEEVPLRAIALALEDKMTTAGAVKRMTRAGMGRCQGRYCGSVVVELTARSHRTAIDDMSYFAPRLPFKPVSIAAIAGQAAGADPSAPAPAEN